MPLNALWEVSSQAPTRLATSRVNLESRLEEWIETDPAMLPGDLEIVGRQLVLEAGRLDLLALDRQGRLHVIEVKRGILTRDTVAQGLDYAACIEAMDSQALVQCLDAYLIKKGKSIKKLLAEPRCVYGARQRRARGGHYGGGRRTGSGPRTRE